MFPGSSPIQPPWRESCAVSYPSGQDGAILPTRDYLPTVSCRKTVFFFNIINSLLTKLVQSRWLGIARSIYPISYISLCHKAHKALTFSFQPLRFAARFIGRSINTQKRTWPTLSHLDWTSLVNNPYTRNLGLNKMPIKRIFRAVRRLEGRGRGWGGCLRYKMLSHCRPPKAFEPNSLMVPNYFYCRVAGESHWEWIVFICWKTEQHEPCQQSVTVKQTYEGV